MGTQYKIVLMPFPFDDFTSTKVRPALYLTNEISLHSHVVVAFISSKVDKILNSSDLLISYSESNHKQTGLKVNSVIVLHKLVTVSSSIFLHELGELPINYHLTVE